jgi:hypothetical protein
LREPPSAPKTIPTNGPTIKQNLVKL